MEDNVLIDELPLYRTERPIVGKITVCGNLLVSAERAEGLVAVTDISDLTNPQHIAACEINASPGKPIQIGERILLPGGHGGLLELMV